MFISKSAKTLLIALVALMLAGFTYAYAAANTVPATAAGDGAGVVSGYTVTAIKYNLNSTNPSNIDSVTFTISPAANFVTINLGTATWYTCTGTTNITCLTPSTTVTSVINLTVVSTNN